MIKADKVIEFIEKNNIPENLIWDFLRANNYDFEKLYDELIGD